MSSDIRPYMSNYIPHETMDVITCPYRNRSFYLLVIEATVIYCLTGYKVSENSLELIKPLVLDNLVVILYV